MHTRNIPIYRSGLKCHVHASNPCVVKPMEMGLMQRFNYTYKVSFLSKQFKANISVWNFLILAVELIKFT